MHKTYKRLLLVSEHVIQPLPQLQLPVGSGLYKRSNGTATLADFRPTSSAMWLSVLDMVRTCMAEPLTSTDLQDAGYQEMHGM